MQAYRQNQFKRTVAPRGRSTTIGRSVAKVFLVIAIVLAMGAFIRIGYTKSWTGFAEKTLWDWLELLIIPVVLATGAFLFNHAERKADRIREEKRAELEFSLAAANAQESALQNYLDRMMDLLLDRKLLASKPGGEIRDIARARTTSLLGILQGGQKGTVLEFLHKSRLITGDSVISLHQVSLSGLDLIWNSNLEEINLAGAFLNFAGLVNANLRGANLRGAFLIGTHLNGADLTNADLTDAILSESKAVDALMLSSDAVSDNELRRFAHTVPELSEGDLDQVFEGTDLSGAIITDKQLATVRSLKGATMPDGSRYDGRFNLPGDILSAQKQGVDPDDPEAMERWYAGKLETSND
jgi:hypothetical protein